MQYLQNIRCGTFKISAKKSNPTATVIVATNKVPALRAPARGIMIAEANIPFHCYVSRTGGRLANAEASQK